MTGEKITEATVLAACARRWKAPQAAFIAHVRNGAGFSANRTIDAVAMDLWPSHGLGLHAIEVKVSRSDLLRELKDPEKAEATAKFCDFFWLALGSAELLKETDHLPPAWGVLALRGRNMVQVKAATKTEAEPFSRSPLAALLRAAMTGSPSELALAEARAEGHEAGHEQGLAEATRAHANGHLERQLASLKETVAAFEAGVGFPISIDRINWAERRDLPYSSPSEIGAAVAQVLKADDVITKIGRDLGDARARLQRALTALDKLDAE